MTEQLNQRRELKGYHLTGVTDQKKAKNGNLYATATWSKFGMKGISRNLWFGSDRDRFPDAELRTLIGDASFDWSEILSIVAVPIIPRPVLDEKNQPRKAVDGTPVIQTAATIIAFADELDEVALWDGYRVRPRGWDISDVAKAGGSTDDFTATGTNIADELKTEAKAPAAVPA